MGLIITLIFIVVVAALIAYYMSYITPPPQSPCTGNCNQGRNCTCVKQPQQGELFPADPWPFPVNKKP